MGHTFASITEKIGISYDTRQHLLGHSPGSMTQHNTKIDVSELHEKLSELENLIE